MPKVSPIQNSFNAGELSPLLGARTDLDRYRTGLSVCVNYVPAIQGPLLRRPGTKYVHPTRHQSSNLNPDVTLVPFKYSRDESYIIEFGNDDGLTTVTDYFRFFKDNGLVVNATVTCTAINSGATLGDPFTVTANSHGLSSGDRIVFRNSLPLGGLDNREMIVTTVSANLFTIKDAHTSQSIVGTSYFPNYTQATALRIFEVRGPNLTASDTASTPSAYKYAQSADVLFFAGSNRPPWKLSRFADTSWTLQTLTCVDGPYLPTNDQTTTLDFTAVSGLVTVTASSVLGINSNAGFGQSDIGRPIRSFSNGLWGHGTITNVLSTVSIQVSITSNLGATGTTQDWRLGAWRIGQYPSSVAFHEGRLCFGGGVNEQLVALSASDDFENFAPSDASGSIPADQAFTVIPAASEANAIQWLVSDEKGLIAGTKGGPWILEPNANSGVLNASTSQIRKASSYGCSSVQPFQVDKATLYIQSSTKKIREFLYYYDVDGFRSADLSVLSEHITGPGIIRLAHQKEPQPILWGLRSDGVLIGLTYERGIEDLKAGWHRHIFGGVSNASGTADTLTKEIAVIPSADGTSEELWMINQRYINGAQKKYIEYMKPFFDDQTSLTSAFFVDGGLSYESASTVTLGVTGLYHLAGQTVSVLADGNALADSTVSTITYALSLDVGATTIHVGLPYESQAQLMRLDAGAADGTALGKTRRINKVGMLLHNTGGMKYGFDFTNMREIIFAESSMTMDTPVPLYSGIKSFEVEADYDFENLFCWQQDAPLPGTIVGVFPTMHTQDR